MQVTILGAGAMGSLFGALLADVADITLLDRSAAVAETICRDGLRLATASGERRVRVPATILADEARPADLALVLVKAQGTAWAAAMAGRVLAPGGLALTLQNGLGHCEVLAGVLGVERVWQGVTAQGATLLGPGHVRHAGSGPTYLETRPGIARQAEQVAALFNAAGLETHLTRDVAGLLWGKLVVNVGINALTAVLRVSNGALVETPSTRRLMARLIDEAVQVARARGIELPYEDAHERVLAVARATAANHSSMLQDIERGRPTEIQAINGAIAREAAALGLPTPANEMMVDLIEAIEATHAWRT